MDNLTHSLIGFVAGDAIARWTRPAAGGLIADRRRSLFIALGAIGGNLPDIDLVQSYWPPGSGDKLGYLLDHRGYTHTILGCVVLAFLLYASVECWLRVRHLTLTRGDRLALGGMALFALGLHLAMDSLNTYGVHPLAPFENRWRYGDAVFIVEPLMWIAVAPLFFTVHTMWARVAIGFVLVTAVALHVYVHPAQPLWCIVIALIVMGFVWIGRRVAPRAAALISASVLIGVVSLFVVERAEAARRVDSLVLANFPDDRTLDRVLSPVPTHPLCWDVLLVQENGGRYIARHGLLSTAPGAISADQCPKSFSARDGTAPMVPVSAPSTSEMRWLGEFSMNRASLRSWVADDCDAAAIMRFVRVPFVAEAGGRAIIGDLRFDREPGVGFAEIELDPASAVRCDYHARWTPPRADLLEPDLRPTPFQRQRVGAARRPVTVTDKF